MVNQRRKDAIEIILQYWDEEWISYYKEYYYGMIGDADHACIRESLWDMPEGVCVIIANNIDSIPASLQVAIHSLLASRLPTEVKIQKFKEAEGITYNLAKENQ